MDAAIADYAQAIKIDPKLSQPYNDRGVAERDQGNDDKAIADYSRAIELNPTDDQAYYNRAIARDDKGDVEGAHRLRRQRHQARFEVHRGLRHLRGDQTGQGRLGRRHC